jgi:uncharacterized membrane protein
MVGLSQMSLESNRTLGGVGALLIAIGSFFPFLSLVGIILVLVAMRGLADYYKDESMYTDALYGFIFGLIGAIAAIALFVAYFFSLITTSTIAPGPSPVAVPGMIGPIGAIGVLILILVVVFIFFLIQAVFYRRAFELLSDKSGEKMFRTAGLLLLIGAILTIVLIGFVLLFVGWIIAAVGFFSMKIPTTQVVRPPLPPPSFSVATDKRYCPYCGGENSLDAAFCKYCGKKLET